MKVFAIFGTRPEAIKMAPVILALRQIPQVDVHICVTGQHRHLLDQVLALFDLRANRDLALMRPNQALAELTATALTRLDQILAQEQPDWVLVQGDTTTAMTGALAAFYRGVKVAHIEAGLRTGDKQQPFPEEINRRLISAIADLHFAPTELARANLLREGFPSSNIEVTGNTVIDALEQVAQLPFNWEQSKLATLPLHRRLILLTTHRRENFGQPLRQILRAVKMLAESFSDLHIVFPVHPNPNVRSAVEEELLNTANITLLEPLEYLPLVQLLKRCFIVLTDSGGLQEEAPGLGKPVLVLRETTERPEGVQAGTVKLVGTATADIVRAARDLLENPAAYAAMAHAVNPYGDGQASARIVNSLLRQTS